MYPSRGGGHDDKALNTMPCGGPGGPAGCWATSTWLGLSKADLGSRLEVVNRVVDGDCWRWFWQSSGNVAMRLDVAVVKMWW